MRARPSLRAIGPAAASLALAALLVSGNLHAQPAPAGPPPPATAPPAASPASPQPQSAPPAGVWSAPSPDAASPPGGGWAPPLGAPGTRSSYDMSERFVGFPPGYAPRKIPTDGAGPPPGYVLGSEPRGGLWITGLGVFGGAYLISALAGGTAASEGQEEAAPLLIPVVGPWVTVRTTDADSGLRSALVIDGIAQLAGVALFISGMAAQRDVFVRADTVARHEAVKPSMPKVGIGPGNVAVVGDF